MGSGAVRGFGSKGNRKSQRYASASETLLNELNGSDGRQVLHSDQSDNPYGHVGLV